MTASASGTPPLHPSTRPSYLSSPPHRPASGPTRSASGGEPVPSEFQLAESSGTEHSQPHTAGDTASPALSAHRPPPPRPLQHEALECIRKSPGRCSPRAARAAGRPEDVPPEFADKYGRWRAARKAKDYQLADALRDELRAEGFDVGRRPRDPAAATSPSKDREAAEARRPEPVHPPAPADAAKQDEQPAPASADRRHAPQPTDSTPTPPPPQPPPPHRKPDSPPQRQQLPPQAPPPRLSLQQVAADTRGRPDVRPGDKPVLSASRGKPTRGAGFFPGKGMPLGLGIMGAAPLGFPGKGMPLGLGLGTSKGAGGKGRPLRRGQDEDTGLTRRDTSPIRAPAGDVPKRSQNLQLLSVPRESQRAGLPRGLGSADIFPWVLPDERSVRSRRDRDHHHHHHHGRRLNAQARKVLRLVDVPLNHIDIDRGRTLGSGAFGSVRRCWLPPSTSERARLTKVCAEVLLGASGCDSPAGFSAAVRAHVEDPALEVAAAEGGALQTPPSASDVQRSETGPPAGYEGGAPQTPPSASDIHKPPAQPPLPSRTLRARRYGGLMYPFISPELLEEPLKVLIRFLPPRKFAQLGQAFGAWREPGPNCKAVKEIVIDSDGCREREHVQISTVKRECETLVAMREALHRKGTVGRGAQHVLLPLKHYIDEKVGRFYLVTDVMHFGSVSDLLVATSFLPRDAAEDIKLRILRKLPPAPPGEKPAGVERAPRGGLPCVVLAWILRAVLKGLEFLHTTRQPRVHRALDTIKNNTRVPVGRGLALLHSVLPGDGPMVHRDLKPANILIDAAGAVKLADFGVAAFVDGSGSTDVAGTRGYIAPEMISGGACSPLCDVWAVGITAVECALGVGPGMRRGGLFGGDDPIVTHRAARLSWVDEIGWLSEASRRKDVAEVLSWDRIHAALSSDPRLGPIWNTLPADLVEFASRCITVDPSRRPGVSTLLKHPFVLHTDTWTQESMRLWVAEIVVHHAAWGVSWRSADDWRARGWLAGAADVGGILSDVCDADTDSRLSVSTSTTSYSVKMSSYQGSFAGSYAASVASEASAPAPRPFKGPWWLRRRLRARGVLATVPVRRTSDVKAASQAPVLAVPAPPAPAAPPAPVPPAAACSGEDTAAAAAGDASKRRVRASSTSGRRPDRAPDAATDLAPPTPQPGRTDREKAVRRLRTKLREISALQRRLAGGEALDAQQRAKVLRRGEVEQMLKDVAHRQRQDPPSTPAPADSGRGAGRPLSTRRSVGRQPPEIDVAAPAQAEAKQPRRYHRSNSAAVDIAALSAGGRGDSPSQKYPERAPRRARSALSKKNRQKIGRR
eukprot:TRINITY_DN3804_c1_g1_i2.p1 TRINITY_DN3804_c1_g1~~TRINITY_DN3804_c1_g1_i2.p1  ORF type:complete len:1312 (+),score=356.62 TRINITY_DN3804_c1_g1_i2:784-4719(+)